MADFPEIEEPKKTRGRPKAQKDQDETKAEIVGKIDLPKKRIYESQSMFEHDLFKLELSKFKKNLAIDDEAPEYVDVEHCHFFHTVDSNGRKQMFSNSVGGHFHKLEIKDQGPDMPPEILSISGPLTYAMRRGRGGKKEKVIVPFTDVDAHTHEVTYVKSNKISKRKLSAEAAKVQFALEAKHTTELAGVE